MKNSKNKVKTPVLICLIAIAWAFLTLPIFYFKNWKKLSRNRRCKPIKPF